MFFVNLVDDWYFFLYIINEKIGNEGEKVEGRIAKSGCH